MVAVRQTVWDDILGHVRINNPELVRGWFAHLQPTELNGGVLQVKALNHAQVRYLDEHCRKAFSEGAQAAIGRLVTFSFCTDATEETEAPLLSFQLGNGQLVLNPDYVFTNFMVGPCNRLAHAAATAVADTPGKAYNPMFIHGSVGLGKTHLLQAICHTIGERSQDAKIMYISCETFTNHFLEAVERGALHQFRYRYRHVDVLVIDDIQFLAERERSQEEFFHTFNTLHQSQRQIILSADSPPSQIPSLEERLISRFNSGLVALMERPCFETRMAIIRNKAKLRCIEVPEEVVHLIASKVDSNIRELEGALIKLDALSQTRDGKIDVDFAHQTLTGERVSRVSIQDILEIVTHRYSVKRGDLLGKKRHKSISAPRQVCMYLARELTPLSLEEIGGSFGGRDHTTVLHAIKRVTEKREEDARFRYSLDEMMDQLRHTRREGD